MAATAKTGPGQGQEPETPPGSRTWMAAGAQGLGSPFAAFPGTLAESWAGSGAARTRGMPVLQAEAYPCPTTAAQDAARDAAPAALLS